MQNIIFEDMVKVMERGQVTIPLKLREIFNLQKGLRLWVRGGADGKIVLEPMKNERQLSLKTWMEKMIKDRRQYFTAFDEKKLRQIREKSKNKLLRLYGKNPR